MTTAAVDNHSCAMILRILKQTDYTVAKRLFHSIFDISEDPNFVRAWRNRDIAIGCFDRGVLIGAAIIQKTYLKFIFIDKLYQNAGIGSKVLKTVLVKYPNIHLIPVPDLSVQRWYKKFGFKVSFEDGEFRIFTRHRHFLRSIVSA